MGTYSGYAEHFAGFAFAVEINIGSYSDHSAEGRLLAKQQAQLRAALAGVRAPLERAVAHFTGGQHGYRRYTALLDPKTRTWTGPDPGPLWSSERRTRGARLPLELLQPPAPTTAQHDALGSLTDVYPAADRLDVYLYLTSAHVPYLVREVIDHHFVAAQFAAGGLCEAVRELPRAKQLPPDALAETLADAWQGVNRHSCYRLLRRTVENASQVAALAEAASPEDPRVQLIARVCRAFLEPARVTPDLADAAADRRQALTLLAGVTTDDAWRPHAAALAAMDEDLAGTPGNGP